MSRLWIVYKVCERLSMTYSPLHFLPPIEAIPIAHSPRFQNACNNAQSTMLKKHVMSETIPIYREKGGGKAEGRGKGGAKSGGKAEEEGRPESQRSLRVLPKMSTDAD